ncbi:histidine kinase [Streptomyces sp. NPDC054796]
MERTDDRLLPVLLLAAQALVWPGAALLLGATPATADLLAAVLVDTLVTAALCARRTRPVPVLVLVVAACAVGAGPLPAGAMAVLGTAGVALALLTVAMERDTTTAVLCVATLAVWQVIYNISLHGLGERQGLDLVLTALLYAAACGTGLHLRRLRTARRTAEQQRHRAQAERHRLPAAERRRMERELHDVSAHHLTAVVVTTEAALGLGERRPELVGEALRFAADTGRTVTRALGAVRAPTARVEDVQEPEERMRALVDGFRSLGQPVTCDIGALPEGSVGDAAYGIVREALTNAVRHAFGAPTRVRCAYGEASTEIVVTNAAPQTPEGSTPHGAGLGGGRGQTMLRGRAREAGGTLTSGPTSDGGWEVRAVLPGRAAVPPPASVPRSFRVAQFAAAFGLCVQPLVPLAVIRGEEASSGPGVSAGVLFALLAGAQAVALLWLRRAPRTASGALLVLAALWPVAMAEGGYAGPVSLPLALSGLATCTMLAVHAARGAANGHAAERGAPPRTETSAKSTPLPDVGATPGADGAKGAAAKRAVPNREVPNQDSGEPSSRSTSAKGRTARTYAHTVRRFTDGRPWVLPAAAVAVHTAAAFVVLARNGDGVSAGTVAVSACAVSAAVAGVACVAGARYGQRERSERGAHEDRLTAWTREAVREAWAERRRITAGLETTVLSRTAEVIEEAEAGRLPQAAQRARDALTAMRTLLDAVRDGQEHGELRPQPTLQALDLLAHQCRATGREVEVHVSGRVPEQLPAEVDLAAYRAAETILTAGEPVGAGGRHTPTALALDVADDTLLLTATGAHRATRPAVRERLATRAAALGGILTSDPEAGTVLLRLPLGPPHATPAAGGSATPAPAPGESTTPAPEHTNRTPDGAHEEDPR